MSTRINLLPHREERRKRARKHFAVVAGVTAAIGLVVVGLMHVFYANQIDTQVERNQFLKNELVKLDKDISEIRALREQIQALLARKQVIETLQADRAQTVHLLDDLVRQMPEGVFIRSVKQRGLRVNVVGFAQSNARVSSLMRNIDASPWLTGPELVEVKAANVDRRRASEFNMNFSLKRAVLKEAVKETAKEAPKAPGAAAKG